MSANAQSRWCKFNHGDTTYSLIRESKSNGFNDYIPWIGQPFVQQLSSMASKPDGRKAFSLFPEKFRKARSRAHRKNDTYMILGPEEGERLDQQHYVLRSILHGNFNSPLEDTLQCGIKVADIGCGYGNWALNMAQDFPASTFIGTDLVESVLPTEGIPPNCSFVKADTVAGLPFPDDTFDYVFQRLVVLSYTQADWVRGIAELLRVTKPGGYVEIFETDGMIERAPESFQKYQNAWLTYTRSKDIDVGIVSNLESLLRRAGLVSIESDFVSVPLGWHDRDGELMKRTFDMLRLAIKQNLAPLMEMTEDEFEQWSAMMSKELEENRSWLNLYYAFGRKV